jgi:histidinol-phosphate aminotransferase
MSKIKHLLRKNILSFVEKKQNERLIYSDVTIRLDDNSHPFGSPIVGDFHKEKPVLRSKIIDKISRIKGVPTQNIFLANSNQEIFTLLTQAFCEPYVSNVLVCPPLISDFEKVAEINAIQVRQNLLITDYQLDIEGIAESVDENTSVIFLNSPNNPTSNTFHRQDIEVLLHNFEGLVIIDETFINYAKQRSFWYEIAEFPNLIIVQNFDVAWGMKGANISMMFANEEVVEILNQLAAPNQVSQVSLEAIDQAIENLPQVNQWIKDTVMLRDFLVKNLSTLEIVKKIYPSETNFLLIRFNIDVNVLFDFLLENDILVKNCHTIALCENCLRISIGTLQENEKLIKVLQAFLPKM